MAFPKVLCADTQQNDRNTYTLHAETSRRAKLHVPLGHVLGHHLAQGWRHFVAVSRETRNGKYILLILRRAQDKVLVLGHGIKARNNFSKGPFWVTGAGRLESIQVKDKRGCMKGFLFLRSGDFPLMVLRGVGEEIVASVHGNL